MKAVLLLLFCFGVFAVFPTNQTKPAFDEGSFTRESVTYYNNGKLKCRMTVYYKSDGSEEKTLTESYRKNGTLRDFTVMNNTDRIQYIKYDKKGLMKFERNYYYYSDGNVESVETRRPNGEWQVWRNPPSNVLIFSRY